MTGKDFAGDSNACCNRDQAIIFKLTNWKNVSRVSINPKLKKIVGGRIFTKPLGMERSMYYKVFKQTASESNETYQLSHDIQPNLLTIFNSLGLKP